MNEQDHLDQARAEIRAWLDNEKREEDEAILALQSRVLSLIEAAQQASISN